MAPQHRSLDHETAERLASGGLGPDDAPPGFRRTAQLLQAAGAVPGAAAGSSSGAALVGAMATAIAEGSVSGADVATVRRPLRKKLLVGKAALALSALTLSASAAGAATGHLPDPIQEKVASVVQHVGLDLPRPDKGVERVTEGCVPAEDGTFAKNRGQYLKQERAAGPEALAIAEQSRCGMPIDSKGEPGADDTVETPTTAPTNNQGKATEDHGQAGDDHGQAPEDRGQPSQDQGEAPESNGKADEDHGPAADDQGQAGQDHGQAADDHGQPDEDDGASG